MRNSDDGERVEYCVLTEHNVACICTEIEKKRRGVTTMNHQFAGELNRFVVRCRVNELCATSPSLSHLDATLMNTRPHAVFHLVSSVGFQPEFNLLVFDCVSFKGTCWALRLFRPLFSASVSFSCRKVLVG